MGCGGGKIGKNMNLKLPKSAKWGCKFGPGLLIWEIFSNICIFTWKTRDTNRNNVRLEFPKSAKWGMCILLVVFKKV